MQIVGSHQVRRLPRFARSDRFVGHVWSRRDLRDTSAQDAMTINQVIGSFIVLFVFLIYNYAKIVEVFSRFYKWKGDAMRKINALIFTLLLSSLIGCTSVSPTSTAQEAIIADETPSPTPDIKPPTAALTPTLEFTSTTRPTSLPTLEPTITYTPSPTPFSFDGAVIDESNYSNLEKFLTLGKGSIQSQAVSEDGRFQIIKTVRGLYIYATETLEELAFFEDYGGFSLIPGKRELVAITPDLTLAVIKLDNQSLTSELTPPDALSIGTIAFSKDASHMAVNVLQPHPTRLNWTSYRIDVWNLDNGALISQLESDLAGSCYQLSFSMDNSQLVSACSLSGGGYPRLFHWDTQTGTLNWSAVNEGVTNFPFSKDGSLVATSLSAPRYIIIRRTSDGTEVGRVSGGTVADNPFSPDNKYLLTQSVAGILVWNVSSSQRVKTISTDFQGAPSFSDDGEYILVSGGQRAYRVSDFSLDESYPATEDKSDLAPQELPEAIPVEAWLRKGHLSGVLGVELFEGDRLIVWGVRNFQNPGENQTLWWWYPDQDTYKEIPLGQGAGQPAWSPSKDQMAVCTQEGLEIITIEDGNIENIGSCRSSSSPITFSGDGQRLFIGSGIIIDEFDISSRTALGQLRGHDYNIGDIKRSDDGKFLFSTSAEEIRGGRESIIWELEPNTFLHKWFITAGSLSNLSDALFTKDNSNLVAIYGSEVSVWRVSDGWYLANFEGNDVTFSVGGKLAVVGMPNSGLDFYDTSNWKKINTLGGEITELPTETMDINRMFLFFELASQRSGVMHLETVNEGRVLISITSNDVIEFWRIP